MKTSSARNRMAHRRRGKEYEIDQVKLNAIHGIGLMNQFGASWVMLAPETRRWASSRRWRRGTV